MTYLFSYGCDAHGAMTDNLSTIDANSVLVDDAEFVPLDPDGAVAWTDTAVNAAEFGIEVA